MGRKIINNKERIIQKSIGFHSRQIDFLYNNPNFKIDKYCRQIMDEQIKLSKQKEFLNEKEK